MPLSVAETAFFFPSFVSVGVADRPLCSACFLTCSEICCVVPPLSPYCMVAVQRVMAAAAVMVAIISAAARMSSSFFLPKPPAFPFPNVPNSDSSISSASRF